jgi:hypothetical protein
MFLSIALIKVMLNYTFLSILFSTKPKLISISKEIIVYVRCTVDSVI